MQKKKKDADGEADDEADENVERKKSKVTFDLTNPVNINVSLTYLFHLLCVRG